MHLFHTILFLLISIPTYRCLYNSTYVLSHINTTIISSTLSSNNFIITNSSYVQRLSSSGMGLLDSIDKLLSYYNIESIAFSWDTGDCSLPFAFAYKYTSINISTPICYTHYNTSATNILQLVVTTNQLVSAAALFMNQYSLTYFSILISDTTDFYLNLAQEFSAGLTEKSFILEQVLLQSNFPPTSTSLRSKG